MRDQHGCWTAHDHKGAALALSSTLVIMQDNINLNSPSNVIYKQATQVYYTPPVLKYKFVSNTDEY